MLKVCYVGGIWVKLLFSSQLLFSFNYFLCWVLSTQLLQTERPEWEIHLPFSMYINLRTWCNFPEPQLPYGDNGRWKLSSKLASRIKIRKHVETLDAFWPDTISKAVWLFQYSQRWVTFHKWILKHWDLKMGIKTLIALIFLIKPSLKSLLGSTLRDFVQSKLQRQDTIPSYQK